MLRGTWTRWTGTEALVVVNPEITWASDKIEREVEGCLSIPGLNGRVPRPADVEVRFVDFEGQKHQGRLVGWST